MRNSDGRSSALPQHAARLLDVFGVPLLFFAKRLDALQHFGKSDDAVQGRTKLVAHVGQKIALEAVHLVEPHVQLSEFVDLRVQIAVGLLQVVLRFGQMPQHPVECIAEFFEFVVGMNVGSQLRASPADRIADIAEMFQRRHDDVPHDDVQRPHRHEEGDDTGRGENRPNLMHLGF
jgi:hypothetical protein